MGKPSVLIIIDVWGWAFDFNSRGVIKYSTEFKCAAKTYNEVNSDDEKHDIIFPLSYEVWSACGERRKWLQGKKRCVGIRSGNLDRILSGRSGINDWIGIGCNSRSTYNQLRKAFPDLKTVHYTPNGVDTEIFKMQTLGDRFQVGWAGSAGRGLKRVDLARKLKFPVKIACNRLDKYFQKPWVDADSRRNMVNFYRSIDCLVLTSTTEGMSNVVLEAASCGLPVISTTVGDIPLLISEEWLVPVNPPEVVVSEMNKKLTLLKNDLNLRREVGRRNREEVEKNWDWRKQVRNYERMFGSTL